jgi:poly(hydroxyalkanoate) depolymerase family esterase
MNALAEEAGCLVLYPEQDGKANRSHCWNWFEPGHQLRDAGEPGIIAGMTRQIIKEQGAEPSQVFVAGMSAGGAMAAVLGAEYPELFAAVGVHSGLPAGSARDMITGLQAMKKPGRGRSLREAVPLIVFHGDADHVVSPGNGEAVLQQFVGAHAGLRAAPLNQRHDESTQGGRRCTRSTWRDENGRAMAEHWLVHGAGHTWAGGNAAGSHTDAKGPCASREMLRFFLNEQG